MPVVTPEQWYRIWWLTWTIAALVAARLWIVQPIIRAQDRTTTAVLGLCR